MQFNMQLFEDENALNEVEGFHFHTLCEQNVDDFELVLNKFEIDFGNYFNGLKWLNFGGGHHMTKKSYKKEKFIQLMTQFRSRYPHLEIFFEPSEAIAIDTGVLVSTVLDIVTNEENIAILDTSAEAHMPDVLAMPYTPNITNANIVSNSDITSQNRYILAGNTCLAGDIIGKYSFKNSLNVGDKIVFTDMIHYSMVKTTTFNGINLPSIAIKTSKGFKVLNNFGYNAYKSRL
jgi:carboxynorspermidine decarboxylase